MKTSVMSGRTAPWAESQYQVVTHAMATLFGLLALGWLSVEARAQNSSIFDPSPPDAGGWSLYDPLQIGSLEAIDGACFLAAGPSPVPSVAPAMVGLERLDVAWADFEISVDLTGWMVGERINNDFGILARASGNPDGTRNGIMLGFVPNVTPELEGTGYVTNSWLGVDIVFNSQTTGSSRGVTTLSTLALDASKWYRLVFRGQGANVIGELYDRQDLQTPLARSETTVLPSEVAASGGFLVIAVDRAGYVGIANNGVAVTLDNIYATEGVAQPEVTIAPAVILTWPTWTAGFVLENADSVDGPWSGVDAKPTLTTEGNVATVMTGGAKKYFRLVRP